MTNWPDPARPGVPLNPERDGWHWLEDSVDGVGTGHIEAVYYAAWSVPVWYRAGNRSPITKPKQWRYLGPILTPDQATALQKRAAKLEVARTIKPLEWKETLSDRGDGTSEHDGGYESATPFGVYAIIFDYLKGVWLAYGLDGGSLAEPMDDPSTAKSIIENDYESRMRAALEGGKDEPRFNSH